MKSPPFESAVFAYDRVNFNPGCLKPYAMNVCSETEMCRWVDSKTNQCLVVHSCGSLKFNLACQIHMWTQGPLLWCPLGCQTALVSTHSIM